MKNTNEITKERIAEALKDNKITSLTKLSQALGYKGNVSGSNSKKIRLLVPNIEHFLKGNQVIQELESNSKKPEKSKIAVEKPVKVVKKASEKAVRKSNYPQHPGNPFRIGSAYSSCFNILASFKQGIHREELVKLLAKETGKDEQHSYYDMQVLLSAKESNNGPRHRSCKSGFWCKRENSHISLQID